METGRKNKKTDDNIDEIFGEDELPTQRLGQGVHNDLFYYCISKKGLPIVITSAGDFYRKYYEDKKDEKGKPISVCIDEIKSNFRLNYISDFDGNAIDTTWENTDIKKYLEGKREDTLKVPEIKSIVDELVKLNKKHVYHINENYHKLISYYTFFTYAYTLFEFAPRINIFAMTSSGKSTQSKIIKYTKFNPIWISKGSESSTFRSVEPTCGVPTIDNFDKIHEELKAKTFHFMEVGFDREGVYRLSEAKGRGWQTRKFAAFCPMEVNSTMPFQDDAVDNRCILVRMEKTTKKLDKLNTRTPLLRKIRNDCRVFVLENWEKILDTSQEVTTEAKLSGRTMDIWLGILTFAKMNSEEDYSAMIELALELEKESKDINDAENLPATICLLLWERLGEKEDVAVDVGEFVDDVIVYDLGGNMDKESRQLTIVAISNRDENYAKFSDLIKTKHKEYYKKVRNILKAFPSVWRDSNISRPKNRERLLVHRKTIESIIKERGYSALIPELSGLKAENKENDAKKEITLTSDNPTNLTNYDNHDNLQKESKEVNEVNKVNKVNEKTRGGEIEPDACFAAKCYEPGVKFVDGKWFCKKHLVQFEDAIARGVL